ncbi:type II secretion system secretin GspD [Roseicella sp. DB1501]|uniref:type II secretion system secretin GspD n=1 Tax=Roseicella sp. DB1501 TaxID=2730925 RepID=UPI00149214CA|nr:type II secretion system secretin GspD [Roseicella sp. DB1501]NOG73697.1 type II secretion system secretin GspD [Roseicella sp. DB1501]
MRRWLLLLLVAGCAPAPGPAIVTQRDRLPPSPAAAPRRDGVIGTPEAPGAPQLAFGAPATPGQPPPPAGTETGDISLDFADTDIREVTAQILGGILRVNYTIDPAVRGAASFRTARPLTRAQLLPTLQALLAQNGATLVQSGALYRVLPAAQAAAASGGEGLAGSVVVPLRHASAEELAKVLQPYAGDGNRIIADPGRNALLIGGDPQARDSLVGLVRSFDIDMLAGQSYALLPVGAGEVKDLATAMQEALRGPGSAAGGGLVRVVPMARANAVLVVAQQPRLIEEARRIYGLVDRARRQHTRSWRVHYLQNGTASDVAYLLQQAFTPNSVTAQPTRLLRAGAGSLGNTGAGFSPANANAGTNTGLGSAGRATQGSLGGAGLSGAGNPGGNTLGGGGIGGQAGGGGLGAGGLTLPQGQAAAGAASNPLLGPLDSSGTETDPNTLRIIPDTQNNALLYYATPREADTVEAMLRKVDILPLQVRIDAVIAEVTLNDSLQYGTQFFFQSGGLNGVLSSATAAFNPAQIAFNTTLPGFILSGNRATGVPFAISALQNVTTVNVLSSPQLMVVDNQTARLQVGDVVPYLSQTSQSTLSANAPVISSINYQQTGVIIEITPRVNSGGLVTLDIAQNVSDVARTVTTPGINSPTFQERSVVSRVVVQDGQTVGLAGLIRDNVNIANQGIPWLKDVPVLGALAGQQDNGRQRTELLIMVTPRVIQDQRGARALTEDLREQLINAAAVPDRLNALPLSGSPDPGERLRQRVRQQLER